MTSLIHLLVLLTSTNIFENILATVQSSKHKFKHLPKNGLVINLIALPMKNILGVLLGFEPLLAVDQMEGPLKFKKIIQYPRNYKNKIAVGCS